MSMPNPSLAAFAGVKISPDQLYDGDQDDKSKTDPLPATHQD